MFLFWTRLYYFNNVNFIFNLMLFCLDFEFWFQSHYPIKHFLSSEILSWMTSPSNFVNNYTANPADRYLAYDYRITVPIKTVCCIRYSAYRIRHTVFRVGPTWDNYALGTKSHLGPIFTWVESKMLNVQGETPFCQPNIAEITIIAKFASIAEKAHAIRKFSVKILPKWQYRRIALAFEIFITNFFECVMNHLIF